MAHRIERTESVAKANGNGSVDIYNLCWAASGRASTTPGAATAHRQGQRGRQL